MEANFIAGNFSDQDVENGQKITPKGKKAESFGEILNGMPQTQFNSDDRDRLFYGAEVAASTNCSCTAEPHVYGPANHAHFVEARGDAANKQLEFTDEAFDNDAFASANFDEQGGNPESKEISSDSINMNNSKNVGEENSEKVDEKVDAKCTSKGGENVGDEQQRPWRCTQDTRSADSGNTQGGRRNKPWYDNPIQIAKQMNERKRFLRNNINYNNTVFHTNYNTTHNNECTGTKPLRYFNDFFNRKVIPHTMGGNNAIGNATGMGGAAGPIGLMNGLTGLGNMPVSDLNYLGGTMGVYDRRPLIGGMRCVTDGRYMGDPRHFHENRGNYRMMEYRNINHFNYANSRMPAPSPQEAFFGITRANMETGAFVGNGPVHMMCPTRSICNSNSILGNPSANFPAMHSEWRDIHPYRDNLVNPLVMQHTQGNRSNDGVWTDRDLQHDTNTNSNNEQSVKNKRSILGQNTHKLESVERNMNSSCIPGTDENKDKSKFLRKGQATSNNTTNGHTRSNCENNRKEKATTFASDAGKPRNTETAFDESKTSARRQKGHAGKRGYRGRCTNNNGKAQRVAKQPNNQTIPQNQNANNKRTMKNQRKRAAPKYKTTSEESTTSPSTNGVTNTGLTKKSTNMFVDVATNTSATIITLTANIENKMQLNTNVVQGENNQLASIILDIPLPPELPEPPQGWVKFKELLQYKTFVNAERFRKHSTIRDFSDLYQSDSSKVTGSDSGTSAVTSNSDEQKLRLSESASKSSAEYEWEFGTPRERTEAQSDVIVIISAAAAAAATAAVNPISVDSNVGNTLTSIDPAYLTTATKTTNSTTTTTITTANANSTTHRPNTGPTAATIPMEPMISPYKNIPPDAFDKLP